MLSFRIGGTTVSFSVWFFAALCVWISTGGRTVLCTVLFMFAHELGHLLAMLAVGQFPAQVTLIAGRFEIVPREKLTRRQDEFVVLSAGIAVNLLLAALMWLAGQPDFCAANLALALFNALPAGDLDGGRLFRLLLERRLTARTVVVTHGVTSFAISIAVMCVGFLVLLRNALNPTVFMVGVYIFVASFKNIRYTN